MQNLTMQQIVAKSVWYSRPKFGASPIGYVRDCERSFHKWYEAQRGRKYVPQDAAPSDCVTDTLIKPDKFVGYTNEGASVSIRSIHASKFAKPAKDNADIEFYATQVSPPLYVVLVNGKRKDAFLQSKIAAQYAKSLVKKG